MCRLFAVLSKDPLDVSGPLLKDPASLLIQSSCDKRRKQGDGWGVGWFLAGAPQVVRSAQPLFRDPARRKQAARQARGQVLLGHVRWASNPLKLPRHELIGLNHTQPFRHGRYLFVHNGTLYIPREVKAALGPWARYVKGKNDSEVLFYWLLKHFKGKALSAGTVRKAIQGLHRIWKRCGKKYPIYRFPYHGLNWALTDGRRLAAFCYVDPGGLGKAKGLCHRRQPYYQLQISRRLGQLLVASEPLDNHSNWRSLGHGQLLLASLTGTGIETKIHRVL